MDNYYEYEVKDMDRPAFDATFEEHDVFDRKHMGEGIINTIRNQNKHEGALTISIDAPWGIGKTTFISMLNNLIKKNSFGWWTVYYDAWENDMTNDPFTSLIFQICGQCSRQAPSEDDKNKIKNYAKGISSAVAGVLDIIPNTYTQMAGKGFTLINDIFKAKDGESITDDYIRFEEHKKALHDNLTAMARNCNKIIVYIDELDRCKPTFAVHVLETIKHYFDIDNMVFIFGIDGIQLRETIKKYYGTGFDSSSYLTRFFEYQLLLPKPTLEQTVSYCGDIFSLPAKTYYFLNRIFSYAMITPREVKSIVKGIVSIVDNRLSSEAKRDHRILYPAVALIGLLLSLKCKKMKVYEDVVQHRYFSPINPDLIDKDLEDLSTICNFTVQYLEDKDIVPLDRDNPISRLNIHNALQTLLVGSDSSAEIGDELIRLLNIIDVF